MTNLLKPVYGQVFFITGATSGIGLAFVREAVAEGAKVFMVARNEEELQRIQDEMRVNRYETAYATADVAEFDQLQAAVDKCIATFGRIDTWINNAGITLYGKLMETTEEEARRLFDTNFWGMVNGCKLAVSCLRERGGVIINVGSVLANTIDPSQGIYTAAEHAMKGYLDSLRQELKRDGLPVLISLIKPGAVDTPFFEHARSKIDKDAEFLISSPVDVARSLLKCAVKPQNEFSIGASSFISPVAQRIRYRFRRNVAVSQWVPGNLFAIPDYEGEVTGNYPVVHSSREHLASYFSGVLTALGSAFLLFRRKRLS